MAALIVALGCILISFSDVSDRFLIYNKDGSTKFAAFAYGVTNLIAAAILCAWYSGSTPLNVIGVLLVGGFTTLLGVFLYGKSLEYLDSSLAAALNQTKAIFVAILAFLFLGESLGVVSYFGVLLVFLGAVIICASKYEIDVSKGILFITLSAACFSIEFFTLKWALQQGISEVNAFAWIFFGVGLTGLAIMVRLNRRQEEPKEAFNKYNLNFFWTKGLITLGILLIFYSASIGSVTVSASMMSLQSVFTFTLSLVLMRSGIDIGAMKYNRSRIFASISILSMGVLMLNY